MEIKSIIIDKNRGWRGLAKIKCYDSEYNKIKTVIFSFSQPVWDDMLTGKIVISDDIYYYILTFDDYDRLPKGQRSVLIKAFNAPVLDVKKYKKSNWVIETVPASEDFCIISHYIHNNNNHTTSNWNCIGIRVTPMV